MRALVAAVMWAAGTATERKKPVRDFLTVADDLLKRSQQMGSPYTSESADVLMLDNTAFAAVRFREWLQRQTPDVQSLYLTPNP